MNDHVTLDLYEQIADITGQMLMAARSGDWNSLQELETHCADRVNTLKAGDDDNASLTPVAREKKIGIIKKILSDDQEIRAITQPRMQQLASIINSSRTERQLRHAYGSNKTG
ncbi:MAG: flagellar protein FliT [Burkholderiaceae bacterium]|nr:flagellar protein FliT [Burkholderiaceae bacterium]